MSLSGTDLSTTTAEDGSFLLEPVPAGAYTLWAEKAGYVKGQQPIEVTGEATASATLSLTRLGGQVAGAIQLQEASSHEGITVSLSGTDLSTTTAEDGSFRLLSVPTGTYTLWAEKDGYVRESRSVTVEEANTTNAMFTLSRRAPPSLSAPPIVGVQGGRLVLRGNGFGAHRGTSTVRVGGVLVEEYVSWTDSEVAIQVPSTVSPGGREVEVSLGFAWTRATFPLHVHSQVTLSSGDGRSVGLKPDGTLVTWGYFSESTYKPPEGLTDVVSVSSYGGSVLALKQDGTLVAFGSNTYGQSNVPPGLSGVVAVYAAFTHSVALKQDGTLVAWGDNDVSAIPPSLPPVIAVAALDDHHLALKPDGTVIAWGGYNLYGERSVPGGLSDVVDVGAGARHSMALKRDGTLVVWGSNDIGQRAIPAGLSQVAAISVEYERNLVLKRDGTVAAWGGYNDYSESSVPEGLSGIVAISAGPYHNVLLKQDGTLFSWGRISVPPAGLVLRVPTP